jgi:DNA-binding HxlR family transcriptional regulator
MRKGIPCILDQTDTSRKTLDLIADKWVILVLVALRDGPRRFAEMHKIIGGITQKMLTQNLRSMERDGLNSRKVYPVVPPKVEYKLSPLGESLAPVLNAIVDWSHGNLMKVLWPKMICSTS